MIRIPWSQNQTHFMYFVRHISLTVVHSNLCNLSRGWRRYGAGTLCCKYVSMKCAPRGTLLLLLLPVPPKLAVPYYSLKVGEQSFCFPKPLFTFFFSRNPFFLFPFFPPETPFSHPTWGDKKGVQKRGGNLLFLFPGTPFSPYNRVRKRGFKIKGRGGFGGGKTVNRA